jgi:hypothetical protein
MKTKNTMVVCAVLLGIFGAVKSASADTHYMPSGCANLQTCFSQMSGGDTLVIADGTYYYDSGKNKITSNNHPPYGISDSAYTIIKAEHDGRVRFDGQGTNNFFDWYNNGVVDRITFQGLVWYNVSGATYGGAVFIDQGNKIKFIRCGSFTTEAAEAEFYVSNGSYMLFEECYAWGDSRYGFEFFTSNHCIARRNVIRMDKAKASVGQEALAGIQNYASNDMLYQNNIVVDIDSNYWNTYHTYNSGAITTRQSYGDHYSDNVTWDGCILLNNKGKGGTGDVMTMQGTVYGHDMSQPLKHSNCVFWDSGDGGVMANNSPGNGPVSFDNCTFHGTGQGTMANGQTGKPWDISFTTLSVTDSIIHNYKNYAFEYFYGTENNNVLYGNGGLANNCKSGVPNATDTTNVNPIWNASNNSNGGLKYIVRTENGSNLSTKSSSGSNVGANVICKTGVDGTLYGETGYNTLKSCTLGDINSLWPWPNEEQIKNDMKTYSETGGPSGTRGFCAPGNGLYGGPITLTSYIWEYLGNEIPCDVYGTCGGDTTAPNTPQGLSVK